MNLIKLLAPLISTGLLSACISSVPIKEDLGPVGRYTAVQMYPKEGMMIVTSDMNKDGEWDLKEYYRAVGLGENLGLFQLTLVQEDTNKNGTFEIYEFIWPKGIDSKITEKLKEREEETNSSNEFFY